MSVYLYRRVAGQGLKTGGGGGGGGGGKWIGGCKGGRIPLLQQLGGMGDPTGVWGGAPISLMIIIFILCTVHVFIGSQWTVLYQYASCTERVSTTTLVHQN